MPISPENAVRYPKNWREISLGVKEAAEWRCEGSPAFPRCRARQGYPHPETRSVVVLTVGHLDHNPEHCERANLKAWCQRCHLTYDAKHHATNAAQTRRRAKRNGELLTPEGQKDLAAVIAEMRARVIRDGPLGEQNEIDDWADRLALLLVEAHPQVLENKEDTDTRVGHLQYDPPSAGPLATALQNVLGPTTSYERRERRAAVASCCHIHHPTLGSDPLFTSVPFDHCAWCQKVLTLLSIGIPPDAAAPERQ